jgi:uncharacterized protein YjbI with pentapeptide repeats
MADKEHLKRLHQGLEVWNRWRRENKRFGTDLDEAGMRGDSARYISQPDLSGRYVRWIDLTKADLSGAALGGMKLSGVDFSGADLGGAHLEGTDLIKADLRDADLNLADLRNADLREADLRGTYVRGAYVKGAHFGHSRIGSSAFLNIDLSGVKGLDTVDHSGPSEISVSTIYRSKGKIPERFLRGAGVPENFVAYMSSLAGQAWEYYSCFISYSSKDQDFAERLHSDLEEKRVRCWYAPEDLKTGDKFRQSIDEAIRLYDKLLVVVSENSIQSQWVEDEVAAALEKEQKQNKLVLFPVRLDDAVMATNQAWAASLRRKRQIGDFTTWKDHDSYQKAFQRLLRDLQGEQGKDPAVE